ARTPGELGVAAPDPREGEAEEASGIGVLPGVDTPKEPVDGMSESGTAGCLRAGQGRRAARRRAPRPRLPGLRPGAAAGPRDAGRAPGESRSNRRPPDARGALPPAALPG